MVQITKEIILQASRKKKVPCQIFEMIKKYPKFFEDQIDQKNSSTQDSDGKNKQKSNSSNTNSKSGGEPEKVWIVYPDSEKYGHLTIDEIYELLRESDCQIQILKNKKKNIVFTIEYFREQFMNNSQRETSFDHSMKQNSKSNRDHINQSLSEPEDWDSKPNGFSPEKGVNFKFTPKNMNQFNGKVWESQDQERKEKNNFQFGHPFSFDEELQFNPSIFQHSNDQDKYSNRKFETEESKIGPNFSNISQNSEKRKKKKKLKHKKKQSKREHDQYMQNQGMGIDNSMQNPFNSFTGYEQKDQNHFTQFMTNVNQQHPQQNQLNFMAPNNFYFQQNVPNGFQNGYFNQINPNFQSNFIQNMQGKQFPNQGFNPNQFNYQRRQTDPSQLDYSNLLAYSQNQPYFQNNQNKASRNFVQNNGYNNYPLYSDQNDYYEMMNGNEFSGHQKKKKKQKKNHTNKHQSNNQF